jgi:transcriptional regulator with XRE-family HTH domain
LLAFSFLFDIIKLQKGVNNLMGTNKFAEMLKYYLMMNNKTQSDLVNDLGYDKSTVSNWCAGLRVPKVDVLIDIADYLHVNVGDLIEDNRNEESYYLNDDARDMAQFMYENPEYKVLFDASRKVKKEDIEFVKQMIDRMSNKGE